MKIYRNTIRQNLITICILLYMSSVLTEAKARDADYIGRGDVVLNDSQMSAFDKYMKEFSSSVFLVSKNGAWMRFFCKSGQCTESNYGELIWRANQRKSDNWYVFADQKKIIWRGTVCYKGKAINGNGLCKDAGSLDYLPGYKSQGSPNRESNALIYQKNSAQDVTISDICKTPEWQNRKYCKTSHESPGLKRNNNNSKNEENNNDVENDIRKRLKELDNILKEGLITKEEAAEKRRQILKEL